MKQNSIIIIGVLAIVLASSSMFTVNMTQTAKLTASDRAAGDFFGHSVCVSMFL